MRLGEGRGREGRSNQLGGARNQGSACEFMIAEHCQQWEACATVYTVCKRLCTGLQVIKCPVCKCACMTMDTICIHTCSFVSVYTLDVQWCANGSGYVSLSEPMCTHVCKAKSVCVYTCARASVCSCK